MSGVSLPVTRPSGRALLVSNPANRAQTVESLEKVGFTSSPCDDPYAAMAELCRRPMLYQALILSLAGLYREEISVIRAAKRRFPHMEIWLVHTDGRQGTLAEAMRLGADGLIDDEGLHRIAIGSMPAEQQASATADRFEDISVARETAALDEAPESHDDLEADSNEPILSAEELRALLQEQPSMPPAGEDEG